MDGDWEMPCWRIVFLMFPCTLVAYFIVRWLPVTWITRSILGIIGAVILMEITVFLTARMWPLTDLPPHGPKQYEPDVQPEREVAPPVHLPL